MPPSFWCFPINIMVINLDSRYHQGELDKLTNHPWFPHHYSFFSLSNCRLFSPMKLVGSPGFRCNKFTSKFLAPVIAIALLKGFSSHGHNTAAAGCVARGCLKTHGWPGRSLIETMDLAVDHQLTIT